MSQRNPGRATVTIRDDYVRKDGTCLLQLRVYLNKKRFYIPLNVYVKSEEFNKGLQKVTKGVKKHIYNKQIEEAIGLAAKIFLKYEVNDKILTRELFEKEYKRPAVLTDFYEFMTDQIKIRTGEITESTKKQQMSCLNKLKRFRENLLLVEVDEEFIRSFEKHLRVTLKNNKNTIYNTLKTIRTYLNIAIKNELIENSPFRFYKLKKEKTYPEYLSEKERDGLISLYDSKKLPDNYRNVLRWFLFSCFTGLRIGDLRSMTHENIKNEIMSYKPKKTENHDNKRIDIPLSKTAKKLIKDENPYRVKGLLFDCISEPRMNLQIKEVMKVAKIETHVTFHTARHTFASLFLKKSTRANGIIILQELLGHANIQTTMIYSHVLNDDIEEAINEFDS